MVAQRKIIFIFLYLLFNVSILYGQFDSLKLKTAIVTYNRLCKNIEKKVKQKIKTDKLILNICPHPEYYSFFVVPTYYYKANASKSFFDNIRFNSSVDSYNVHMLYQNKYVFYFGSDPGSHLYYFS